MRLAVWFASEGQRRGSATSKWGLGQTDGVLPDCVVTGVSLSNTRVRARAMEYRPVMHDCPLRTVSCRWAAEREAGERDGCGI
jgi:hypothetical protein